MLVFKHRSVRRSLALPVFLRQVQVEPLSQGTLQRDRVVQVDGVDVPAAQALEDEVAQLHPASRLRADIGLTDPLVLELLRGAQ